MPSGWVDGERQRCSKEHAKDATLGITVSALGEAKIQKETGLESMCAAEIVEAYPFAATGEARVISATFDFSKPIEPDWLTRSEYAEAHPAPRAEEPKPETPAATPTAESAAAPAPVAPPQAPDASSPPSPANSPESGSSSKP